MRGEGRGVRGEGKKEVGLNYKKYNTFNEIINVIDFIRPCSTAHRSTSTA